MRRTPLPPELRSGPFLPGQSGLSAKRVRAGDLDRSIYGVRIAGRANDLLTKCGMVARRVRSEAFFSHTTAALLYGAPLSFRFERDPRLHVSVADELPPPHAHNIVGHHLELIDGDVVMWHGLRITSPERTWFDLAATLRLEDLVAVGDFLIHRRSPLTTQTAIQGRLQQMTGKRGVRLAREAVEYLTDRCESRPESWVRVIAMRAGLPEPEINHTIVDGETGQHVRPDFLFRAEKLILEYQGDYHRTRKQWRKDMTRRARLEASGWYVMELNWDDVQNPDELASRIRSVLARRR